MAITYGSANLGSSANGAFAIYTATTTGAEAVSVLRADFTTNVVSAVPNAVPLTPLQTAALSTLLAKVRAAAPGADPLALLRKLVGVLSTENGVSIALSVSSVGAVHTLIATTSAAATSIVYVPNSAAAGLFTGFGSDADSSVIPTSQKVLLSASFNGVPGANQYIGSFPIPYDMYLAADALQIFTCRVFPTAPYQVNVRYAPAADPAGANISVYDIDYSPGPGSHQAAVTPYDLPLGYIPAGSVLWIRGQTVPDATISGVQGTITGTVAL